MSIWKELFVISLASGFISVIIFYEPSKHTFGIVFINLSSKCFLVTDFKSISDESFIIAHFSSLIEFRLLHEVFTRKLQNANKSDYIDTLFIWM